MTFPGPRTDWYLSGGTGAWRTTTCITLSLTATSLLTSHTGTNYWELCGLLPASSTHSSGFGSMAAGVTGVLRPRTVVRFTLESGETHLSFLNFYFFSK